MRLSIYEPVAGGVGGLGGSKAEAERRASAQQVLKIEKLFELVRDRSGRALCLGAPGSKVSIGARAGGECRFVTHSESGRGRKPSWRRRFGDSNLFRDVDALRQTENMNYEQAIKKLRKDKGEAVGGLQRIPQPSQLLAIEKHVRWNNIFGVLPNN